MPEELNVKVGDKVLYHFEDFEKLVTVTKVISTGKKTKKINMDYCNIPFDKYGKMMEVGYIWYDVPRYVSPYISIPTERDYKRLNEKDETISKALSLISKINKQNVTYKQAKKIIEILDEDFEL